MQIIDILSGLTKNPILVGISSLVLLVAVLLIGGKLAAWLNAWRQSKILKEVFDARVQSQNMNQSAQNESDALRKKDR